MDKITYDKLRAEVTELRKLRHDLIMRKFAFLTAFMGTGAINIISSSQASLNFDVLLFLVPFVAIAFDFYIFVEDYRIKRVGEFLKRLRNLPNIDESQKIEGVWEEFVMANPNTGQTFAFFVVTLIYAISSLLLLLTLDHKWWILACWFTVALFFESWILQSHRKLRRNLENSSFDVASKLAQ